MHFDSTDSALAEIQTPCLAVPLALAKNLDEQIAPRGYLRSALRHAKNEAGEVTHIAMPEGARAEQLIAFGVGDVVTLKELRKIGTAVGQAIKSCDITSAAVAPPEIEVAGVDSARATRAFAASVASEMYRFRAHKKEEREKPEFESLTIQASKDISRTVALIEAFNVGQTFARELGNLPGNECTPDHLLAEAKRLSETHEIQCFHMDESEMEARGMGAFLSVSRGSAREGRLIRLDYLGAGDPSSPTIILVGKGITFDTGGISLKKPDAMDEMKFDMCGAAAVFGALLAAVEAKLPLNVIAIAAAAENMPSGKASRPGDVVTAMSGTTVEILNTDAEGRLVLCDALTYARELKPRAVIDVATLTGACVVALGERASGLFTPDDALADALIEAGEFSGDRVWRLPVWEDYREQLKTPLADLANVGGSAAGAITAAAFLSTFTEGMSWAHLDIAGTAWKTGKEKGATGAGVGVLFEYLLAQA